MRHSIIAITFLLFAITGYSAVPLDEVRAETKNTTITVKEEEKPVILETSTLKDELTSTSVATTTTDKIVEVLVLETSSTSSTSVKSEPTARTTKSPPRTRTTKAQKTRRTTIKPGFKQPNTRDEWLKLIENEMAAFDKKKGNSPIANKNLTIISERILKYLVENGTQIGISLREQKDGTIKYMKTNSTIGDKIYGDGTESKFPPVLEFVVQRIQSYFSVYAHEDQSRPARPETEKDAAELREEPSDDDDDDDEETSTLTNDQVIDQLQDELSEFIGSEAVKNVTEIKLPSLIKSAYEKFSSWFVPSGQPSAKEEPTQESAEDSTETTGDKKPEKKPSIIKGAYDALEAILSVFDDIDVSDEEEKAETPEGAASDAQLKESQDDLEDTEAIKETVGENLYDFLKLAYTLYDADES